MNAARRSANTTRSHGDPMKTVAEIELDLREAGRVLKRTPFAKGSRPAELRAAWPDVVREAIDAYGYTKVRCRGGIPSPLELDRMDEAWGWLWHVKGQERQIIFARAIGATWRALQEQLDISHVTLSKIHKRGISQIAAALEKNSETRLQSLEIRP